MLDVNKMYNGMDIFETNGYVIGESEALDHSERIGRTSVRNALAALHEESDAKLTDDGKIVSSEFYSGSVLFRTTLGDIFITPDGDVYRWEGTVDAIFPHRKIGRVVNEDYYTGYVPISDLKAA